MMDAPGPLEALWQWLRDHLPAPVAALPAWVQVAIALGTVLVGTLVLLALLLVLIRILFGRRKATPKAPDLEEDLGTYPPLKASGGDRRLVVEGVPVRLRLVVLAPAGSQGEVDEANIEVTLERIVPG